MKFIDALLIGTLFSLGLATQSLAQDRTKKTMPAQEAPAPSMEQRQKMATMHQQMADCLRSSKPMNECHQEMKKNCMSMDKGLCPMTGHHGKGQMMHHESQDHTQ